MLARLALMTAACALAGAAAGGPEIGWQSYDNAMKISAATGKPVCVVFYNDKVELNGGT
jgi:hypothetical protein